MKHRLAAILAADAAGYSRLMAVDDQATVAALDAARAVFRARVEARQGRIIDMAGESVLAVFGTATGALNAALAIQAQLNVLAEAASPDRGVRFRIGIHLDDEIEKADGTVDACTRQHRFTGSRAMLKMSPSKPAMPCPT